jgi:hypothetical protein
VASELWACLFRSAKPDLRSDPDTKVNLPHETFSCSSFLGIRNCKQSLDIYVADLMSFNSTSIYTE